MTRVLFSENAFLSLVTETKERLATETGGIFLGKMVGDTYYVVETLDPGPNSTFSVVYFEYDTPYVNHLANKVTRLYEEKLDVIGLWHRHPGSLDTFSYVDDETNLKFAKLDSRGAISALVNIDPEFRLTMYHVSNPLRYEKIMYDVSSEVAEHFRKNSYESVIDAINDNKKAFSYGVTFDDIIVAMDALPLLTEDPEEDESATSEDLVGEVMSDLDYLADHGFRPMCRYSRGILRLYSEGHESQSLELFRKKGSGSFAVRINGKPYPYKESLLKDLLS